MSKPKILITGITGLLGSSLNKILRIQDWYEEIKGISRCYYGDVDFTNNDYTDIVQCDITEESDVVELFQKYQPDIIFHLGAIPVVKKDVSRPFEITRVNTLGTHHLLEHCPRGTRFVFASTVLVYDDISFALYQGALENCSLPKPKSVYGASKLAAEALVNAYTADGHVRGINLRLCANVGKLSRHGLIHDLIHKARHNDKIELLGDAPGSIKPYISVRDTVEALILSGRSDKIGTYNVCVADAISVDEVCNVVQEVLGTNKEKVWLGADANWTGDSKLVRASNRLFERDFKWTPKYGTSREAVRRGVMDIMGKE